MWAKQKGFTIVELLIVIVVIAILAAITIVSYNGIQNRARTASITSALSQAVKKITLWQVDNQNSTPANLSTVGINDGGDVSYQYLAGTNGVYCITATSGTLSYKITESTQPAIGGCAGHGQGGIAAITNYQPNPKLTVDFSGYSTQTPAGNTQSRTTGTGPSGEATYNVLVNTAGQLRIAFKGNNVAFPATAGEQYNISFYFYSSVSIPGANIEVNYLTPTSVYVLYPIGDVSVGWKRYSTVITVPASTTSINSIQLISPATVAATSQYRITKVQITKGTTLYEFADGDTANWMWNGTANNSTSKGPAL